MEPLKYPAIIVLTGASGAGKTTLIERLNERAIPNVKGINCDRVNIPESARSGDRQPDVLRYWIASLGEEDSKLQLAVLDTQIRPHIARHVLEQAGVEHSQIVLVNCDTAIRNERLINERKQPDLANPQMDCWAAYLCGQADAMGLSIIDTGNAATADSFRALQDIVRKLLVKAKPG